MSLPVLHIHAQSHWHETATIVGNREGLERLRVAVDLALKFGGGAERAFTSDGEGYEVQVRLRDCDIDAPEWAEARLPYVDEMASGNGEGQI